MTYKRKGRKGVCGTTIGADGAGEYAFVIEGTPEEASAWAVAHVRNEEAGGARFENVTLVLAEECYSGPMLQIVTPNAELTGRRRLDALPARRRIDSGRLAGKVASRWRSG